MDKEGDRLGRLTPPALEAETTCCMGRGIRERRENEWEAEDARLGGMGGGWGGGDWERLGWILERLGEIGSDWEGFWRHWEGLGWTG